jgi:hypothetical protein
LKWLPGILALVLFPRAAGAAELAVKLPACEKPVFDYAELMAVLATELAGDELVPRIGAARAEAELDVDMPCLTEAEYVVLRVRTADGRRASRRMDLADLPIHTRPRGVAVVAAEIVRAAQAAEIEPAPSEPEPLTATPAPPLREAPAPPRTEGPEPSFRMQVAGEGRLFVQDPTPLFGGMLGVHVGRTRIALHGLRGGASDRLGDFTMSLAAATVGVDVWRWQRARTALSLGPRIGGGILVTDGQAIVSAAAKDLREPYFDAVIECDSRVRLERFSWLTLGIDAGYARAVVLLAGNGRVVARPEGILTALRLGIAFAP